MDSPLKYFAELRDPRVERTREHLLEEILLIAIAAILSGANGWNEIEDYAEVSLTSTVFCLFWRVPREKFFVFNYGLAPSENSDEWYQILYLHSLHVIRYIVPCVHSQNHQDAQGQKLRQLSPRRVRKHAQRSAAKNPLFPRKSCARPARALAEPGAPPAGQLGRPARPDDHGCVPGNRSRKRAARK